jgi:hypothetical protein
MRRRLLIVLVVAAMSLGAAQTAFAAATSHISIFFNQSTSVFHGRVTSPNSECHAGRTVKLFKKTASGRVLQGKTLTGSRGRWHIDVMHPHGHYFAVTPRQKIMNTTCGRAVSRTIDVM